MAPHAPGIDGVNMATYRNKAIQSLSAELSAGLARLQKGYVDAAEALIDILDPKQKYPLDFVVFRITSFRQPGSTDSEPLTGKSLAADLSRMILHLCETANLRTSDYTDRVYDTPGLSKRFNISTKTVQRWRKRGLVARKLIFPDGRKRIAFLESSVQRYVERHSRQVQRSSEFSQLTDQEKQDVLRRARRISSMTHCSLSEAARRIADKLGRAVETVRYTIRDHDVENPREAIFSEVVSALSDEDKRMIYRSFLNGVSIPMLVKRYHRSRGSIYRIVNEMRARQLLDREIDFIYNPQFDLPNADELILSPDDVPPQGEAKTQRRPKPPAGLPPYLRALYDVPLLSAEQERSLFRQYNYYKFKADKLRRQIDLNKILTSQLRQIEALLLQANVVKNRITRANLRLVVSIAKKHLAGPQNLFELISDGNMALMRAVEKFDYSKGFRFSTYSSWAIMRNFARSVPKEKYQLDRFSTGHEQVLDIAASLRTYDPNEVNLPELRESIEYMLQHLSPREQTILTAHYGLRSDDGSQTFDQLGKELGISKERVRQIELKALKKLRRIMKPQEADLLN
ncbi:MAG: sigma-70 family RNA polymerase sigma factor [Phycisphaerae bacterium]